MYSAILRQYLNQDYLQIILDKNQMDLNYSTSLLGKTRKMASSDRSESLEGYCHNVMKYIYKKFAFKHQYLQSRFSSLGLIAHYRIKCLPFDLYM